MAPVSSDEKLRILAETEGYDDPMELLQAVVIDSVCPGICTNPDCDYTTEVESDCRDGWCEECSDGTVASALILAEVI